MNLARAEAQRCEADRKGPTAARATPETVMWLQGDRTCRANAVANVGEEPQFVV